MAAATALKGASRTVGRDSFLDEQRSEEFFISEKNYSSVGDAKLDLFRNDVLRSRV